MRLQLPVFIAMLGLVACTTTERAGTAAGLRPPVTAATAAQRTDLYPQVARYLTQVAALEPAYLAPRLEFPTTGLPPGWRDRVCPQVTGLPAEEAGFVLKRILEVATAAGARVGGKDCSPNLHVLVTTQPQALLKVMQRRNEIGAYGPRGRPYLLDEFITTSRPVRVWYDIYAGAAVSFAYAFSSVFVVADQAQLRGVSLGQLADYVAVVGLAEIKPDARPTGAPTLLNLFNGAPQAAPAGLSDWDRAFLKSLYSASTWPYPWERERCQFDLHCGVDTLASSMVTQIIP